MKKSKNFYLIFFPFFDGKIFSIFEQACFRNEIWAKEINLSILVFSFTTYSGSIQNLKTLALTAGEKEKCTNKGNDKQEDVDSLLYNTTSKTQCLYKFSEF